ncbi:MAG TPA: hypothetical protein VF523_07185 [Burkholderiales bacterium]
MQTSKPLARTRKGSRRTVEVCCAAWVDLLGYGILLREAGFQPLHPAAQRAVERLRSFHRDLASSSMRAFNMLVMNDGAVAFKDLSPRSRSVTADFLQRAWALYQDINKHDMSDGFPGTRMVVAAGFRVRMMNIVNYGKRYDKIKERRHENKISEDHAIAEALRARPYFGVIPELEANFAFTKAYLVDQNKKYDEKNKKCDEKDNKGDFPGPAMYVDAALFDEEIPDWITVSRRIPWNYPGLTSTFLQIEGLDRKRAGQSNHAGILSAFEIASRLGASQDLIDQMRASSRTR